MKSSTILSIISLLLLVAVHECVGNQQETKAYLDFLHLARRIIGAVNETVGKELETKLDNWNGNLKQMIEIAQLLEKKVKQYGTPVAIPMKNAVEGLLIFIEANKSDLAYWNKKIKFEEDRNTICHVIKGIMIVVADEEYANQQFAASVDCIQLRS